MQRSVGMIVGAGLVAAVTVLVAMRFLPTSWIMPQAANSNDAAKAVTPDESARPIETTQIVALGRLVPGDGVIDVGGTAGDRLMEIKVAPGAVVQAGEELARFESYTLREAEVSYAEAALKEATQRQQLEEAYGSTLVEEAKIGVEGAKLRQLEIEAQRAKLALLSATQQSTERDRQRLAGLDTAIVSEQQQEHQQLAVNKVTAELQATQISLEALEQQVKFGVAQAEQKLKAADVSRDRLKGAVQLSSLEHNVKMAKARLQLSTVRAPVSGRVLDIVMHPGETIGQRPILRMGDTNKMYAMAEVYETEIGRVQAGQSARITSHALAKPLDGRVETVGSLVGKNEVVSLDPTKSADLRVVEVRVLIDPASTEAAARLVNLQVQVAINTGQ